MPSPDILKVLLILLPGFVTTGVIRALTISPEEGEFDKVVRALSYSFINYMIFAVLLSSKPAISFLDPAATPLSQRFDIVFLGLIALGMGCLVSAYKNNDWHRFLRRIKLTYRSSRPNIWHDSLVEGAKFHVVVTMEDGKRIMGWPVRYSDSMDNPSLFLSEAVWLSEEEGQIKETPAGNEGILLLAPMKIASVEFVRAGQPATSPTEEEATNEEEQNHV